MPFLMRFDELQATNAYDGVWASAALLHAPWPALPGVLTRIFGALKPGGLHAATYKTGEAAGRDGLGRYFNYPSIEALRAAYRGAAVWEALSFEAHMGGDYEGGARPWATVTARKPG